jgi:hypothetical protein
MNSFYVEGRQILDRIILSHEVVHSLKSTKSPGMLIKLDMSKDFDKLNWKYIKEFLLAFGFHPSWISWIMILISSTLFSLLINGSPSPPFRPPEASSKVTPFLPSYPFLWLKV